MLFFAVLCLPWLALGALAVLLSVPSLLRFLFLFVVFVLQMFFSLRIQSCLSLFQHFFEFRLIFGVSGRVFGRNAGTIFR